MSGPPSDLYKIEDILGTERDESNNAITAQLGDVQTETPTSQGAEWWQHSGFCSRPPNATTSSGKAAAQAVALEGSDRDTCIASRDIRGQQLYANLGAGECCIYGAGADGLAQGRVICKADGSVTLYTTTTNTSDGQGVYLKISPTEFRFEAPWGRFFFDATGFHFLDRSGARIDGGSIGGLPPPLSAISSMVTIGAAAVTIDGTCLLGSGPYVQCATSVTPGPIAPGASIGSTRVCVTV